MNEITNIKVFYKPLPKRGKEQTVREYNQAPENPSNQGVKLQVGRMIDHIYSKAEYYYVVIEYKVSSGNAIFRTVVPKTFTGGN